jgi:hypothetical protein
MIDDDFQYQYRDDGIPVGYLQGRRTVILQVIGSCVVFLNQRSEHSEL